MISTDIQPPGALTGGVSPQVDLYASAIDAIDDDTISITMQHVAKQDSDEVRAINISFNTNTGFPDNGQTPLSQFVDWSTRQHDVLYVIGGPNLPGLGNPYLFAPADSFNKIAVGASEQINGIGKWRKVASYNASTPFLNNRRAIDILAPGSGLLLTGLNNTIQMESGTSFAAPHVTGTIALLQEHAATEMGANANATRHEVMKAVLMNSADKIEGILGMERTVVKKNGMDDWFDSVAHTDPTIPLDEQMGAGHLNAKRAIDQFSPGEFEPGSVPFIGWDFGFHNDPDNPYKYVFNQQLEAGDHVSVTLVWDREVMLETISPPFDEFKPDDFFVSSNIENLDLYLLPAGSTDANQAIWSSTSSVDNVEHIFAEIPQTGNYEFWVTISITGFLPQADYAVAWWAGSVSEPTVSGDYNGDSVVDMDDYDLWVANFGSMTNLDADGNGNGIIDAADYTIWRDNFGAGSGSVAANVPEPSALALFLIAGLFVALRRGGSTI